MILESISPVKTIIFFSLSFLLCELIYSNAFPHDPNGDVSERPSLALSLPVDGLTYTTVAASHLAYKFTETLEDVFIDKLYVKVFESLVTVPVLAVHPPNPYPVGLSIKGFSISSTVILPFFTGTRLIFCTISASSPVLSDNLPFFSLSVSPCANP